MNLWLIIPGLIVLAILLWYLDWRRAWWKPKTAEDRQKVLNEALAHLETRYQLERGLSLERFLQSQPTARRQAYALLASQMNEWLRYKHIRLWVSGSMVCWLLTERVSKRLDEQAGVTS